MKNQKSIATHQLFKRQSNGEDIFIYEALIELDCQQCAQTIESEKMFSRNADKKGQVYGVRYNKCSVCVPFKLDLMEL